MPIMIIKEQRNSCSIRLCIAVEIELFVGRRTRFVVREPDLGDLFQA